MVPFSGSDFHGPPSIVPLMAQSDAKQKDQSRWISWVAFEVGRSEQASPGFHGPSFLVSPTSRSHADHVNVSRPPSYRNPIDRPPAAEETAHSRVELVSTTCLGTAPTPIS
jgi:hypothetical protein